MFSSLELSIPTNLVPTAVTSVDSKTAAAIMAAPIKIAIELPKRSGATARCP
jgi:hypothetical protein